MEVTNITGLLESQERETRNDTDFTDMYSSGDLYAVGDIYGDSTEFYEEYMDSYNDTKKTENFSELTSTSEPLLENCTNQVYFYLTIILGSLLLLSVLFSVLLFVFIWIRHIKEPACKKVSRAESWRYESSVYVNPGRQKPSIPVYVPSPTIPVSSFAAMAAAQQIAAVGTGQHISSGQQYNGQQINRNSRLLASPEVIPEEGSNYNTLERISTEGSTRAASPQQSPFQNRRDDSSHQNAWSRTSTLNGQIYRTGTPGNTPLTTPQTSPLLQRSRPGQSSGHSGHNRNGSLSSALRGVDIIRCTTPGYPPPPSPPTHSRRRKSPPPSPRRRHSPPSSPRRRQTSERSERDAERGMESERGGEHAALMEE